MGLVLGILGRWLDDLDREYDEDTYNEVIIKDYHWLMTLSCLIPKLKGWWRIITPLQFIIYIIIVTVHLYLFITTYVILSRINFALSNEVALITLLTFFSILALTLSLIERRNLAAFHVYVHRGFYSYLGEELDPILDTFHKEMMKERKIVVGVVLIIPFATCLELITRQFLNTYGTVNIADIKEDSIEFNTPVNSYFPFPRESALIVFILAVGQCACGAVISLTISAAGIMFFFSSQNIIKQYKILIHKMLSLEERSAALYEKRYRTKLAAGMRMYEDEKFMDCLHYCLGQVQSHHNILLKSGTVFANAYRVPIFLTYTGGSMLIALALITTSFVSELPGTSVACGFICIVEIGYMYMFSYYGQKMTDSETEFRYTLYKSKWYNYNRRIKSSIIIMQTMASRPVDFSFCGIFPVNMETFSGIMNSAYSFYNVIVANQ